nr:Cation efflux family [uncultured bacterium]
MTGSSGMMAESLHSLADTTNQVFLLLGLRFYRRPASEKHPFGYGKERFFWSFIAAIFIFGVGATYAIYEGINKLYHPHPPENLGWAYWVLGISFVLESGSIALALYQEVKEALRSWSICERRKTRPRRPCCLKTRRRSSASCSRLRAFT